VRAQFDIFLVLLSQVILRKQVHLAILMLYIMSSCISCLHSYII